MMLVDLVITSMIIHYLVKMNNTSDDLIKATCPKISSCNDFNVPVFLFRPRNGTYWEAFPDMKKNPGAGDAVPRARERGCGS